MLLIDKQLPYNPRVVRFTTVLRWVPDVEAKLGGTRLDIDIRLWDCTVYDEVPVLSDAAKVALEVGIAIVYPLSEGSNA